MHPAFLTHGCRARGAGCLAAVLALALIGCRTPPPIRSASPGPLERPAPPAPSSAKGADAPVAGEIEALQEVLARTHAEARWVESQTSGFRRIAIAVAPEDLAGLVAGLRAKRPDARVAVVGFYPPSCLPLYETRKERLAAVRAGAARPPRPDLSLMRPGAARALGLDAEDRQKVGVYLCSEQEMKSLNPDLYRLQAATSQIGDAFLWPSVYGPAALEDLFKTLDEVTAALRARGSRLPVVDGAAVREGLTGTEAAQRESAFAKWKDYIAAYDRWLTSSDAPAIRQVVRPDAYPAGAVLVVRNFDGLPDAPTGRAAAGGIP